MVLYVLLHGCPMLLAFFVSMFNICRFTFNAFGVCRRRQFCNSLFLAGSVNLDCTFGLLFVLGDSLFWPFYLCAQMCGPFVVILYFELAFWPF